MICLFVCVLCISLVRLKVCWPLTLSTMSTFLLNSRHAHIAVLVLVLLLCEYVTSFKGTLNSIIRQSHFRNRVRIKVKTIAWVGVRTKVNTRVRVSVRN